LSVEVMDPDPIIHYDRGFGGTGAVRNELGNDEDNQT